MFSFAQILVIGISMDEIFGADGTGICLDDRLILTPIGKLKAGDRLRD